MKGIQFILIPGLLVAVIVYIRRFRTQLLDRLFVIFAGLAGILLLLKPEWTNFLAEKFGVGRGADLITYLSIIALVFFCLILWAKLRDLDARLTAIVRAQALSEGSKQVSHEEKRS